MGEGAYSPTRQAGWGLQIELSTVELMIPDRTPPNDSNPPGHPTRLSIRQSA